MRKRFVSTLILVVVFIPILLIGGNLFNMSMYILSMIALNEFLRIKESRKEIPIFIKSISFITFTFIVFAGITNSSLIYKIDYRVLSSIFLLFLIPIVFYHDRKIYSVNDAFFFIGGILFLGIAFSLFILIRNISLVNCIYLVLISVCGDIYAYLTGKYIGHHKLLIEVSKNKTIEGLIGGVIFGTFIPFMYLTTVSLGNNLYIFVMTLSLAILGQLGDLCFSAIKRYYGKKDFSDLIPGHGGIIDVIDSIIFILLGFMFFIKL